MDFEKLHTGILFKEEKESYDEHLFVRKEELMRETRRDIGKLVDQFR